MNRKIIIGISVLMLILATFAGALAQGEYEIDETQIGIGDPDFESGIDSMNLWDKFRFNLAQAQAFTVIDGATCSINPDKGYDWSSTTLDSICYTNGLKDGVAFQLFDIEAGWKFLGEKQLSLGEKGCFDIESGKKYHYDLYYCDKEVVATCDETDSGKDYSDKGVTTVTVDGKSSSYTDTCNSANQLKEMYCDSDDSLASRTTTCDCKSGACVETSSPASSGKAIDITIAESKYDEYEVGDTVYIRGVAKINSDISGGVIETSLEHKDYVSIQPFSITETSRVDTGVCGDDETTGIKFNAPAGESVIFTLKMKAKEVGRYSINVISAEGCGQGISDSYYLETFDVLPSDSDEDSDPDQDGTVNEEDSADEVGDSVDWGDLDELEDSEGNTINGAGTTPAQTVAQKYFDYKNNPAVAYSVTLLIVLILALIVGIIFAIGGNL